MCQALIGILVFGLLSFAVQALPHPQAVDQTTLPDQGPYPVHFGLYITKIYDLDVVEQSFETELYAWWLTTKKQYEPVKHVVMTNAYESQSTGAFRVETPQGTWTTAIIKATVQTSLDTTHYPFDVQTLRYSFEDSLFDDQEVIFVPDTMNTKLYPGLFLSGWDILDTHIFEERFSYDTTFGNPSLKKNKSIFSRLEMLVKIKRAGSWNTLLSDYSGFFLSFFIILALFFLNIRDISTRIALAVGAIFSVFSTKMSVSAYAVSSSSYSLTDAISDSSVILTFMCITSIIGIEVAIHYHKREQVALKINRWACIGVAIFYLLYNAYFISRAVMASHAL